jgi:endonuclease III
MVRGVVPRQPAKSGRHPGVARKAALKAGKPSTRPGRAEAPVRPRTGRPEKKPGKRTPSPRRDDPLAPERMAQILERLDELYPEVTCALHHHSAWELLVATILSAQSTDANVNRVTPELFRKYPNVEAFAALTPEQLQPDVYSTGFFRNKAKSVVGAAKRIVSEFGGQVPEEMEQLLSLPGVARKTANVLLGTWFRKAEGVVVDTHVTRIARRLELTKHTDAPKIEQDLMQVVPREKWILFSHQIIWHGRKLCVARRPKCADCALENLCHAADKTWTTVEIHKNAKP